MWDQDILSFVFTFDDRCLNDIIRKIFHSQSSSITQFMFLCSDPTFNCKCVVGVQANTLNLKTLWDS